MIFKFRKPYPEWLWVLLAAFVLVPRPLLARDCQFENGEERWSIKTSVPSVGTAANGREVSLASLISLNNPTLTKPQISDLAKSRWSGTVTAKDIKGRNLTLREGDIIIVS